MEGIKDLFDKISSYNIFNYLLPGILFVILSTQLVGYNLALDNNLLGAFLYYFIGMIISRVGSLLIEPILKKLKFLKFSEYKDFVIASKKDSKIELLSEVNNTYRTILSMLITLICLKIYLYLKALLNIPHSFSVILCVIIVCLLFLFSYKKQSEYITKRIKANNQ